MSKIIFLIVRVCVVLCIMTSPIKADSTVGRATPSDQEKSLQAATLLGVRPQNPAPRILKRIAWRLEGLFLSLITKIDPCHPPDSKLSLRVMWWKALFSNDRTSPTHDEGLNYDLLPAGFRLLVSPCMVPFYPRWMHTMIEIRTAYLDRAVKQTCQQFRDHGRKIRLVSVGGGYDIRSLRLAEYFDAAIELDLPPVVKAKRVILTSKRFQKRRPGLETKLPTWYEVDLNDTEVFRETVLNIFKNDDSEYWHTIFIFEGVLMYLNEGVPTEALRICRQSLRPGQTASLIFADAVEHIPHEDGEEVARQVLMKIGWGLVDWLPKGGRTRHMGTATSI